MKPLRYFALVLVCSGAFACKGKEDKQSAAAKAGYRDQGSKSYTDADFSEWMSKAEQQVAHDAKAAGTYFAYTEGRNEGGFNQYRHAMAVFPKDKYLEWGVFWGLSPTEFYDLELKMLKDGFIRENLQVFTDSQGLAMHQVVWVKPNSAAKPAAK